MTFYDLVLVWVLVPIFSEVLSFELAMALTSSTILMFLFLALDYLISIVRHPSIEVYEDDGSVIERLRTYINSTRLNRVRLIEYSTASIRNLLVNIKESGSTVELLICNPHKAINKDQKDRICSQIRRFPDIFQDTSKIKIRCYSELIIVFL